MTQNDNDTAQSPRKPGRPKGSIRYPGDQAALVKIAERSLEQPDASFTKLANNVGFKEENEIRRLRGKWKEQSRALTEQARLRRDARRDQGLLGDLAIGWLELQGWIARLADSELVNRMARFSQHLTAKAGARRALGLTRKLPFDVNDKEQLLSAFASFEARDIRTLDDMKNSLPENAELKHLPQSTRYYMNALIYYQLSLDALAKETDAHKEKIEPEEASK